MLFFVIPFFISGIFISCSNETPDTDQERNAISTALDAWHKAAAKADYNTYFSYLAADAIFIGTDATENWDKQHFMVWAKPFFDKGKAWDFTSMQRHIFFDKTGKTAWFDELLKTQMKICRGSGVLVKMDSSWKIQQYVLSMTFPNDKIDSVLNLKGAFEDRIMDSLMKKR